MGRDRAADPVHRLRRRHRIDEALARGADQDRQAEMLELPELGNRLHALFRGLAEADPGIEHDRVARDAGLFRDAERIIEERVDVGYDADGGLGLVAVVHDDDRHAMLADHAGHVGIALQAPDVVDDARAQAERPIGDLRLQRVDRDGHAHLHHGREHGLQPRQLLLERHRLGAAIGAGRFGADVDDVGAFLDHLPGMLERDFGFDELAAVGEGIRGDVEDAHDDGAVLGQQQAENIGQTDTRARQSAPRSGRHRQANLSPPSSSWRVALRAAGRTVKHWIDAVRGGVSR